MAQHVYVMARWNVPLYEVWSDDDDEDDDDDDRYYDEDDRYDDDDDDDEDNEEEDEDNEDQRLNWQGRTLRHELDGSDPIRTVYADFYKVGQSTNVDRRLEQLRRKNKWNFIELLDSTEVQWADSPSVMTAEARAQQALETELDMTRVLKDGNTDTDWFYTPRTVRTYTVGEGCDPHPNVTSQVVAVVKQTVEGWNEQQAQRSSRRRHRNRARNRSPDLLVGMAALRLWD